MQPPEGILNAAQWIKHCRQIRARADDVLSGRMGLVVASRELARLRVWTRGESDPDLTTFHTLDDESRFLPAGPERAHWNAHGLAQYDSEIDELEARWRERAFSAARNLAERYAWSIDARNAIRDRKKPGGEVV